MRSSQIVVSRVMAKKSLSSRRMPFVYLLFVQIDHQEIEERGARLFFKIMHSGVLGRIFCTLKTISKNLF